jgi:arginase
MPVLPILILLNASIQGELLRAMGGVKASASLLGVPLGHNSSFLQGPAFAPPRIREAIWCGSTNSSTEEGILNIFKMFSSYVGSNKHFFIKSCLLRCAGKELNDPRVLTDVGDVPIQEIRDCGVEDDRLMHVISESVKTVMEEVSIITHNDLFRNLFQKIQRHFSTEVLIQFKNLISESKFVIVINVYIN